MRFGTFEVDLRAMELRKHGVKIKLQDQPFQILVMLLERPGEVVTREQLHQKLWPGGTFIDFDHGLNNAIQRLRLALGDSAENPRFVETLARRGYRFLAPLDMAVATPPELAPTVREITEKNGREVHPSATTEPRRREILAWTLVAMLSIALGVLVAIHLRQPSSEAHAVRFELQPGTVTLWPAAGAVSIPAISPDGQRLAFPAPGAKSRLWVRSLDSSTVQPLPETEEAVYPFWSPDSRFVGYYAYARRMDIEPAGRVRRVNEGRVEIRKIDVAGGPPVTLCSFAAEDAEGGGTWNQDGIILFVQHGILHRVSAAGGEAKPVLQLDKSRQEVGQKFPWFLPDGRHFVYRSHSAVAGKSGIYLGSLDSRETRMLIPGESNVSYAAPGFLIYGRKDTLLAHRFDINKLQLTGEPVPIAEHVARAIGMPFSLFSASQNGVLVYRGAGFKESRPTWYSRSGVRQAAIGQPSVYWGMSLAADETRLAVMRAEPFTQTTNIWTLDLATGILSRQTINTAADTFPVWSPDGRNLVFTSDRDNHPKLDLYQKVVGGVGEQLLFASHDNKLPYQWLRDGSILFLADDEKAFYLLPLTGERKPVLLFKPGYDLGAPNVSSDGHWVAYMSVESGRWEVYVATFPAFTEKRQVSSSGGGYPLWRRDGKELFYLSPDRQLMSVEVKRRLGLKTGVPEVLFPVSGPLQPWPGPYCATGNGKRFIILEPGDEPKTPFTVVLNWAAGLKR
jgi:DNA-binding winged helix-turn-helix (wHTH) protein